MKRRKDCWSPEEVQRVRAMMLAGCKRSEVIARELGRSQGATWHVMRQHCSDLLPPKRIYDLRNRGGDRKIIRARIVASSDERAVDYLPPQPYHPLHDNPRIKRILGGSP